MKAVFDLLHAAFHMPDTTAYRVVQGTISALIVVSIGMLVAEASVPEGSQTLDVLTVVDRVILAIFAVEILLRLATVRPPEFEVFDSGRLRRLRTHFWARVRFAVQPLVLVDVLAVLAFFPELRGLRALRLLRLLRTGTLFRYHNPFQIVVRALEDNSLLFGFAFSVLGVETVLGGLSIYFVEGKANPSIHGLGDGIWWALVTLTTVGFGDITPVSFLGRIVGGVLMVGGMFTLALFAGIVGTSLVAAMLSIREEQFRMSDYVNHIVICGWDEATPLLLQVLRDEVDLRLNGVVLFADADRPRELAPDFLWVRGDPTKESELAKVRLTHASSVIIPGCRVISPQASDARTILTIFTIRRSLEHDPAALKARKRRLYVVAEILDSENMDHARAAGADEVIETRRLGYSMLAHAVRHHGTADTLSRVLLSGSFDLYVGSIPATLPLPLSYGELLTALALTKKGGLVIGLRMPGGEDVFNPAKSQTMAPGTRLIYLAEQPLLPD